MRIRKLPMLSRAQLGATNYVRVRGWHMLPASPCLQLRWLDWLVKQLRRRHPHPIRVV